MTDMSYDPDADAAYIRLGRGKVAETAEIRPGLIIDYDADGRMLSIEILSACRQLAPGDLSRAPGVSISSTH